MTNKNNFLQEVHAPSKFFNFPKMKNYQKNIRKNFPRAYTSCRKYFYLSFSEHVPIAFKSFVSKFQKKILKTHFSRLGHFEQKNYPVSPVQKSQKKLGVGGGGVKKTPKTLKKNNKIGPESTVFHPKNLAKHL